MRFKSGLFWFFFLKNRFFITGGVVHWVREANATRFFLVFFGRIKIFFVTLDIKYTDDLFVGGLNEVPHNSPKKKEALLKAYELGLALVKV